jgi:integrase
MTLAGKPELLGQLRISNFRRNIWRPAVADANLACLRIRGFRHTAVALWIAARASPKEVAARAGHTSMSFVLDRYGHLFPEADTALQARLDGLFRGATEHRRLRSSATRDRSAGRARQGRSRP